MFSSSPSEVDCGLAGFGVALPVALGARSAVKYLIYRLDICNPKITITTSIRSRHFDRLPPEQSTGLKKYLQDYLDPVESNDQKVRQICGQHYGFHRNTDQNVKAFFCCLVKKQCSWPDSLHCDRSDHADANAVHDPDKRFEVQCKKQQTAPEKTIADPWLNHNNPFRQLATTEQIRQPRLICWRRSAMRQTSRLSQAVNKLLTIWSIWLSDGISFSIPLAISEN